MKNAVLRLAVCCASVAGVFTSCAEQGRGDGPLSVVVDLERVSDQGLFTDVRSVCLETSDASLLNYIENILVYKDTIVIHSLFDQLVGFYTLDGRFVRKLTIGNGPDEILNPADVCLDKEQGELWVLDRYTNSRAFSFEGKDLHKTISTDHGYMKLARMNGTHMLFDSNMSKKNDYCYRFIKGDEEWSVVPKDKRFAQLLYIATNAFAPLNDSIALCYQQFDDAVYSWNTNTNTLDTFLNLTYKGASSIASWPGDYVIEHSRDSEYQSWYKNKEYVFGFKNMQVVGNHLFFTAAKDQQRYYLYDIDTQRIKGSNQFITGFPVVEKVYKGEGSTLLFTLKPHEIIEFAEANDKSNIHPLLIDLSGSLQEDDNPVLFIVDTKA